MIQGHHALLTDVKAVTLYRFGITQNEKGWTATVILDI
jgi:SHS2 domain-containing protein